MMYKEFINILIIDNLNILTHRLLNIEFSYMARWFLLHSLVNFIVVYYSINDIYDCVSNINKCYDITWNNNSIKVYNYATILHIYHCIFFRLTRDDKIHHFFMVVICGSLCYIMKSIISSFALFFLSGLPGAIDYMLLYMVKTNRIYSITEKKIYTILSAYVRSPGCILTFAIGMNGVINYYYDKEYFNLIILLMTITIIFWNGQYYFMKSHESYIRKL